jgi:hypothetical protein
MPSQPLEQFMRLILLATAAIGFASVSAFAQPRTITQAPDTQTQIQHPTGQKPIDNGPTTPQSNSAYQGGGVVLQGAPGAPAPQATPTPPGQVPANAVPGSVIKP